MPKTRKKPWWSGWKAPSKKERKQMMKKCGKKCFLGPNLSFPICTRRTCKKNKRGIRGAYIRARQWGKPRKFYRNYWGKPHMKRKVYTRVAKKARRLLGWKKGGRRKTRRKRRKRRKQRGGGWRTVSDGDVDTNLETTVEILRQMIREQQRVRISSEHGYAIGGTGRPYEGTVNRVWVVDPAEDDPSIIGLVVPEYYIPYAGEPNRAPCQYGGPYSGEYFHRPIKIELWEEPKRPKSARKTSKRKKKSRTTPSLPDWPITVVGTQNGGRRKTRKKRGGDWTVARNRPAAGWTAADFIPPVLAADDHQVYTGRIRARKRALPGWTNITVWTGVFSHIEDIDGVKRVVFHPHTKREDEIATISFEKVLPPPPPSPPRTPRRKRGGSRRKKKGGVKFADKEWEIEAYRPDGRGAIGVVLIAAVDGGAGTRPTILFNDIKTITRNGTILNINGNVNLEFENVQEAQQWEQNIQNGMHAVNNVGGPAAAAARIAAARPPSELGVDARHAADEAHGREIDNPMFSSYHEGNRGGGGWNSDSEFEDLLGGSRRRKTPKTRKKKGSGGVHAKGFCMGCNAEENEEDFSLLEEEFSFAPFRTPMECAVLRRKTPSASPIPPEISRKLLYGRYIQFLIQQIEKKKGGALNDNDKLLVATRMEGALEGLNDREWERMVKYPRRGICKLHNANIPPKG